MATLTLSSKLSPFPYAAVATAAYTSKAQLVFDDSATGPTLDLDGSQVTTEEDIVKALATKGGLAEDSAKAASYFALAKSLTSVTAVPQVLAALDSLDDHLAWRTFLISHELTSSDLIVWGSIKGKIHIYCSFNRTKYPRQH